MNCQSMDEIYQELEVKIKEEIQKNGADLIKFNPFQLEFDDLVSAGDLINSENLAYLNRNYVFTSQYDLNNVSTPRKGVLGKIVLKIKRRIYRFIAGVLGPYFKEEQDYRASVVRFLNENAKYIDKRDINDFLQVIKKIDNDLFSLNIKIDSVYDELSSSCENYFDKITKKAKEVNEKFVAYENRLDDASSIVNGLESIVARQGQSYVNIQNANSSCDSKNVLSENCDYILFENRYRGTEDSIYKKMKNYVSLIKEKSIDTDFVVEVGAGRGELLECLKEEGINSIGVEIDDAMCNTLKEKNLNYVKEDIVSYLKTLKDASVSSIIAVQVVEHLSVDYLKIFLKEARRVLKAGGSIFLETVNSVSLLALSQNFFRDPTHKMPIHPDTLAFLVNLSGFKVNDLLKLSPYPDKDKLKMIPQDAMMNSYMIEYVKTYNENVQRLNDILYGFQDYCLIAN